MSNYGVFAEYYDRLCNNLDYEVRSDYISGFFNAEGIEKGALLDLACGTGEFSKLFSQKGYNVTGIDLSEEMLAVASSKCDAEFLKADMRSFDFRDAFDCCLCCIDSINHLTDIKDWKSCFDSVAKSLRKDGVFVFDVNTIFKHNNVLAGNSFIFDEEDFFLAWDNEDACDNKVRIFLDFFIENNGVYERYSESFEELALSSKTITGLLIDNFEILGIYNDLSKEPEREDSERLYFVCKRK